MGQNLKGYIYEPPAYTYLHKPFLQRVYIDLGGLATEMGKKTTIQCSVYYIENGQLTEADEMFPYCETKAYDTEGVLIYIGKDLPKATPMRVRLCNV